MKGEGAKMRSIRIIASIDNELSKPRELQSETLKMGLFISPIFIYIRRRKPQSSRHLTCQPGKQLLERKADEIHPDKFATEI